MQLQAGRCDVCGGKYLVSPHRPYLRPQKVTQMNWRTWAVLFHWQAALLMETSRVRSGVTRTFLGEKARGCLVPKSKRGRMTLTVPCPFREIRRSLGVK